MSESIQPIMSLNADQKVSYPGVSPTTLDGNFGAGSTAPNQSFINRLWLRIRRNTTGDNVFGQEFGQHNFLHQFLDPTHAGPPYIWRITEVITPSFGASVGRIFFGFGEFIDVTDATSLRGLGFYCDETGNWFALLSDALGDRVRFDSAADTNQPRTLRVDIDGNLKTVRWYVDDLLVTSVKLATALDQIASGSALLFNDVVIQSDAGNQIDAFIAPGIVTQMVLITDEKAVVLPSLSQDLTYQRVLNLARTRHPSFENLVFDDNMVIDEINSIASTMIEEGSMADHSAFQHVVNWATDVFPSLDQTGGKVDLRDYPDIILPGFVVGVYAVEAVRLDGTKIIVQTKPKESETRDRLAETDSVVLLRGPRDPKAIPRAFKLWDPTLRVWKLQKDETAEANPWQDVIDANFVVDGIPFPLAKRGDLTNNIPMPFQGLLPMVERYAVTLAGRAGLPTEWRETQRQVAELEMQKWRDFIAEFDMIEDEPFDPEIN